MMVSQNYTYDTTQYTITFEVTDVAGQLVADTHVEKADGTVVNEAVFTNVYKAPISTPKTSDQNNMLMYAIMMGIALMAAFIVNVDKKIMKA